MEERKNGGECEVIVIGKGHVRCMRQSTIGNWHIPDAFQCLLFLVFVFGFLAYSSILPSLSALGLQSFDFEFKIMILPLEYLFIFTPLVYVIICHLGFKILKGFHFMLINFERRGA